jgi:transposase-like protein
MIRNGWLRRLRGTDFEKTSRPWSVKQRISVMLGFKGFSNAAITITGIDLLHRIRKGQFKLRRLGVQDRAAPAIWNAVLRG